MIKRSPHFTAARDAMRAMYVGRGGPRMPDRYLTIVRVAEFDQDVALLHDVMTWLAAAKFLGGRVPDEALPLLYALRWALFDIPKLVDLRLDELREEIERLPDGILERLAAQRQAGDRRDQ